jgi:hypothetical protein
VTVVLQVQLTVLAVQLSENKKICSSENTWQIFYVLIRSLAASNRGAGGIRTLVQTSNYNAFYMFSFQLDFRSLAGRKLPTHNLASLEFHRHIKAL